MSKGIQMITWIASEDLEDISLFDLRLVQLT